MARPRKQVYTMKQYLENVSEGYISNNASTQRNPKWKPIIDGLVVTIVTDDYIPPIILAEEENGRKIIVDGGSRTAAFNMFEKGNYKIKASVEDPIIPYKKMEKDKDGNVIWSDAEFDIRNKTFGQFPKELQKKFYEYQVETVIHECSVEQAAKYLRRYNVQTGMNANEQLFIHIPKFADTIREIIKNRFFLDCNIITENEKDKGVLERVISESVMCMFHFDNWNKNGKKIAKYLNDNAKEEDFDVLNNNVSRLEKIVTKDTKHLFNTKNTFVWITLFNHFTKTGLGDEKFADFLNAFSNGLGEKEIDDKCFYSVDEHGSTKDKNVIADKLYILETLMNDYLHIESTENIDDTIENTTENISEELQPVIESIENNINIEETPLNFIRENVKSDADEEDIKDYDEYLDNIVRVSSPIYQKCKIALLALTAYVYTHEQDEEFAEWLEKYQNEKTDFSDNQAENYIYILDDFENYMRVHKEGQTNG